MSMRISSSKRRRVSTVPQTSLCHLAYSQGEEAGDDLKSEMSCAPQRTY
jgi:hypothetical protein